MKCITVSYGLVSGYAKQFQYWQPALYETRKNKSGVLVWRYIQHLDKAYRSPSKAKNAALTYMKDNVIYVEDVRNNAEVKT